MHKSARGLLAILAAVVAIVTAGTGAAWAQAGPVGPSVPQYAGPVRWPDAAYDTQNHVYLFVWGPGTIRGIFVGEDGVALGPVFQISDAVPYAQTPRVAYSPNAGAFLVVWHSSEGVTTYAGGTRVRGRTVSYTAGVSAAPTQVYSNEVYSTFWERGPAIAYSTGSQRFLVAYDIGAATVSPEIYARLVDTAGNPVGAEIVITNTVSEYDREPAVGYFPSTNRFVVAWSGSAPSADYVYANLVNAADGSLAGPTIAASVGGITYVPEVSLNSTTGLVLVTWIQNDPGSGGWRPFARFLDGNGSWRSSSTRLSATIGAYDANSLAYNPVSQSFFLVTHLEGSVHDWGFEITGSGLPVAAGSIVTSVSPDPIGSFNPRIASSTQQPRWVIGTAASFASLWTQVIGIGSTVYRLSVSTPTGGTVTGGGISCGTSGTGTCSVTYTASTAVTLTATPASGYTFTGWGGSCSGTSASTAVAVDGIKTCTAAFTASQTTYKLTVSTPTGGTVTGGGISCGTSGTGTCSVTYTASTAVTLTATPDSGYSFTSWGGSCSGTTASTTVAVDGVKTCTTTFTSGLPVGPPYTMTISPVPTGGTVTGAGLNCGVGGAVCSYTAPASMPYGLQATPASGYRFTGWTGNCSGTSASTYVALTGARTCGAVFTSTSVSYQLTVSTPTGGTVTGGGISCGTSGTGACSVTFTASTTVTLTASPDANYSFTGWGGSCSGAGPSTTVTVDGVKLCTATFGGLASGPPYTMTISPVPTGGTVTGAGVACGTGGTLCSATMPASMPYGLQATPDAGYAFAGWTGNCSGTSASLYILLSGARTCSATFTSTSTPTYRLTVTMPTGGTVTGGGISCGTSGTGSCSVTYTTSTPVTLTAAPASGYTFASWGGSCAGTATTTTVTVDGVKSCTATFTTTPIYSLTLTTPTGGTVTGGGISCGTSGTGSCSVTYTTSTPVTLTAAPASGYTFVSWGGSCAGTATTTTVTVDGIKACTATFTAGLPTGPPYTMTISPVPTGGTVTGAGLACGTGGAACAYTAPASMPYGLQATPDAGYTFTGWTGNCSGTSASLYILLSGARTCSATFTSTSTTYSLTVATPTGGTVTGGGISCGTSGSGTCSVTYTTSTPVTLTATPASGYTFASWGGSCSGTARTTTVTVDGARSCTATFTTTPTYSLTVTTPTGGTVTGGGISCGTSGTGTCSVTYTTATTVTLTAVSDAAYSFTGWGGSCSGTGLSATVTVDSAKTCTATFGGLASGPPYTMTISPVPTGGTVTGAGLACGTGGAACAYTAPASMPYGLQATPDAGYTFTGWTGNCSGTSASLYILLSGARTCGATFTSTSTAYSLTVTAPTGGTVTGGGISCGTSGTGTCSVTYTTSTPVTLTASPDAAYSFTGWGGSCSGTGLSATVTVDSARTCTAAFGGLASGPPYTMTISPAPMGGTVTGAGLACGTGGAACAYTAPASMPYGMQATPDAGFTFTGWTGNCSGTNASLYILLSGARTCSATFTRAGTQP